MFDQIINWINSAQAVVVAIVALITAIITAWLQIKEMLKKTEAKRELKEIAIGAITDAETGEGKAVRDLLTQHVIPGLTSTKVKELDPNEKHEIATTITAAKGKTLIAKLGKAFDIGLFVKEVYQSVKPAIKSLRKGK